MKLHGKKIEPPKAIKIAIPRDGEGEEDLIFICKPVLDYSVFEQVCPEPKPPLSSKPGKRAKPDFDNAQYAKQMEKYSDYKTNWMILESLSATEGLEWETVDRSDPKTWANFKDELREFLTDIEASIVMGKVMEANIPTEERQREALDRFARRQAGQAEA